MKIEGFWFARKSRRVHHRTRGRLRAAESRQGDYIYSASSPNAASLGSSQAVPRWRLDVSSKKLKGATLLSDGGREGLFSYEHFFDPTQVTPLPVD
jgi:hypothetical protein